MSSPKKLFVGATRQNDGKTMVSLGLFNAIQKRMPKIAYMKPVGQQYKLINGEKIDKDAVLFSEVYGLKDTLSDMSPVAVPSGFTENYIVSGNKKTLEDQISNAYGRLTRNKEFLLIEGTGHAGVGSVFDMSNADVAKLLGTKVVLVGLGGIGRAIDEIMLNKARFDLLGVPIVGVIVNKVIPQKYDKVNNYTRRGLERLGIRLLGLIPHEPILTVPRVSEVAENLRATILCGEEGLSNKVDKFVIGAMLPHDALDHFSENTVLVVPANREELVMTALFGSMVESKVHFSISGIVFTGGIQPHEKIMNLIRHSKVPIMLVPEDSFNVAGKINSMLVKVQSDDKDKISKIQDMVEKYVDVDFICENL